MTKNARKPSAEFFLSCKLLSLMNYAEFSLFPVSQLWVLLPHPVSSRCSQRKKNKPREHLISDDYTFPSLLITSRIRQIEDSGHDSVGHQKTCGLYRGLELLARRQIADFRGKWPRCSRSWGWQTSSGTVAQADVYANFLPPWPAFRTCFLWLGELFGTDMLDAVSDELFMPCIHKASSSFQCAWSHRPS